jgi:hypothetical protein
MNKNNVVHIHNVILFCCKREFNLTICTYIEGLEIIMLSEVILTQNDKYLMIPHIVKSKEELLS